MDQREPRQIALRVGSTDLEGDQNWQMAHPEKQWLEASLAQAREAQRREADQVPSVESSSMSVPLLE